MTCPFESVGGAAYLAALDSLNASEATRAAVEEACTCGQHHARCKTCANLTVTGMVLTCMGCGRVVRSNAQGAPTGGQQ